MVIRGKVRELYDPNEIITDEMLDLPLLEYQGRDYIIKNFCVLGRNGALIGTLLDFKSYKKILDASLKSEEELIRGIENMFLVTH